MKMEVMEKNCENKKDKKEKKEKKQVKNACTECEREVKKGVLCDVQAAIATAIINVQGLKIKRIMQEI